MLVNEWVDAAIPASNNRNAGPVRCHAELGTGV